MVNCTATLYSAELEGIDARPIEIEVDLHVGLHAFNIVGLADKALNEAKERVNSALKNSGAKPPNRENRKITVNLAPANIKKTGSQYDLAIALGYLLATGQMRNSNLKNKIFVGELALDGRLRPIHGALNIAQMAHDRGYTHMYLPQENANEAAAVEGIHIVPLVSLEDALQILEERKTHPHATYVPEKNSPPRVPDFGDIKGQASAKRALTIAAAGGHNVLFIGPPGVGKSMLAQALVGILPNLHREEAIEVTKIYSAAGMTQQGLIMTRPFRAPHQTASLVAIIGGGTDPRPGEISLAHRGILFLDELPEFPKNILESLRAPLEAGIVHIARAKSSLSFPAKFTLIAAMNPCPCGFYGDPEKACTCNAYDVLRYQKKISGPLLDRIDMQLIVPRVELEILRKNENHEPESPSIKAKTENARLRQTHRFSHTLGTRTNSEMTSKETEMYTNLDAEGERFIGTLERARLSPRGYYRLLKTARTIADLEMSDAVTANHLAEAFSYRLREET